MFAINHAATALIIKKEFATVPISWILISVQFMELLWVLLNFLGIERTTTEKEVRYVGDVHLAYMPFSHSIFTMVGAAFLAWLVISKGWHRSDVGLAVALGIISHLILDLLTHSHDIALAPFSSGKKFGLGLYARYPMEAFTVELLYGLACWWLYRGSWTLLSIIIIFNLANISMFSSSVSGIEKYLANRPLSITTVILGQILITLFLVGYFS